MLAGMLDRARPLDRARQLRREMTLPEGLLWRELRGHGLGAKFRRQVPLGPFIVDFYCAQTKLVVEVDGAFHGDRMISDRDRALWLDAQGYRVLRVRAVDVLTDLDAVLEGICLHLTPPPAAGAASSPARGEGLLS
jgi:very-short-patch-repair endonuclease